MHYRYRETVYHIAVVQGSGEAAMTVDGKPLPGGAIPLVDDGSEHIVELTLGRA
jgi:cellobiose phosphorylase